MQCRVRRAQAGAGTCRSTPANVPGPQFVMARADFDVDGGAALKSAVAFVTAQQSPLGQPDARLGT